MRNIDAITVTSEEVGKFKVEVHMDEMASNPREAYQPFGTLALWGSYRSFSEGAEGESIEEFRERLKENLREQEVVAYSVRRNMESLSLGEKIEVDSDGDIDVDDHRNCVGYIYVYSPDIKKEFNLSDCEIAYIFAETFPEKIKSIFEGEIESMSAYLSGEVYGYVILAENGSIVSSCWGFIGGGIDDNGKELSSVGYCLYEGMRAAKVIIDRENKEDEEAKRYMAL